MQLLHLRTVKLLVCSVCLLKNNISFAGAWMQPKGASEIIFQVENKELFTFYKNAIDHENTDSSLYVFQYYDLFYQYGAKDNLTIGFNAKWYNYQSYLKDYSSLNESILLKNNDSRAQYQIEQQYYIDSHYKLYEQSLAEYKIFAQTELWSNEWSLLSIRPSIGGFASDNINMVGVSFLYGENFKIGSVPGYINIEAGADNIFDSSLVDSSSVDSMKITIDLTLGVSFTEKQMFLIQSLNSTDPLQALKSSGDLSDNREFANIGKVSWVYKYNEYASWQTGYSTNLTNRDQYIANSVITGLWLRF